MKTYFDEDVYIPFLKESIAFGGNQVCHKSAALL